MATKPQADKLMAEWFWIDRWMGSSAFLLPMEARGLYREMLTQAWRRGARLPNNHEAIRRAIGATLEEWLRCWPLIERFWFVNGDDICNETQQEVYEEARARQERASSRGRAGAQARLEQRISTTQATTQVEPEIKPPSPSPSPSPSPVSDLQSPSPNVAHAPIALAGMLPRDHLKHGWCSSRGKCVPEFLHNEFVASVGGDRRGAEQRLRAFYEAVEAGWPDGPIGDDPVKLWRREFAAKFPSVAPVSTVKSSRHSQWQSDGLGEIADV